MMASALGKAYRQTGFTLLEVMVALGIFAIMGLAAYKLLSTEIAGQERLQQHSQQQDQWRRAMRRINDDFEQLTNRSIRGDYGETDAALVGYSEQITFTRNGWINPLGLARSDLQRVNYRVEILEDEPWLVRRFWPQLDRAPGSDSIAQYLLPHIERLQIRYYNADTERWQEYWPNNNTDYDSLPAAVELIISSTQMGDVVRLFAYPHNAQASGASSSSSSGSGSGSSSDSGSGSDSNTATNQTQGVQ